MLDGTFLRGFFERIESSSDEELDEKIAQVETLMKALSRGSEAAMDAWFLLRHLRREKLGRLFKSPSGPA
jgi:hypothetical protein